MKRQMAMNSDARKFEALLRADFRPFLEKVFTTLSPVQLFVPTWLGSYRTAWFMAHRIREAMTDIEPNKTGGPLGGDDKVVEADETVVGGKAKNRAYRDPAPKKMVATLVERGGRVRSKHGQGDQFKNATPVRYEKR